MSSATINPPFSSGTALPRGFRWALAMLALAASMGVMSTCRGCQPAGADGITVRSCPFVEPAADVFAMAAQEAARRGLRPLGCQLACARPAAECTLAAADGRRELIVLPAP